MSASSAIRALHEPRLPSRRCRLGAFVLVLLLSVVLAHTARADAGHTFALNWARGAGAEGCISSRALAYGVEQIVGPVFRPPVEADRAIEGIVTAEPNGGFLVTIRLADANGAFLGQRELEGRGRACDDITASILLIVALVIDPDAGERDLPPELLQQLSGEGDSGALLLAELEREARERASAAPSDTLTAPPTAHVQAESKVERTPNAPPPTPERSLSIEPRLGVSLSGGLSPTITPGLSLGLALVPHGPVSFASTVTYWTRSAEAAASGDDVIFRAAQLDALVNLALVRGSRARLEAGVGGTVGMRWVDASALQVAKSSVRPYVGPTVDVFGTFDLGRLFYAWAEARATLEFPDDRFVYRDAARNSHVLFEPARLFGVGSLGLGLHL